MTKYKIADLFSGVGGLSHGFQEAGFEIVAAFDNWQKSTDVYNANFNSHKCELLDLSDIGRTVTILNSFGVDGIIGGPPCQDFSSAGKRNEGDRANLTTAFSRIISLVKPKFFLMENVATARNSKSYMAFREQLIPLGYSLCEIVLDASYFGVPQRRKRFFSFGANFDSTLEFEVAIDSHRQKKATTVRDYFGESLDINYYYRHPRNYNRRAIYSIDEPSATIRGVNRPIAPNYPGHRLDASAIEFARPLNAFERAQIQTFPKDFVWVGTKTNIEQMIGNAVPPLLAKVIALSILKVIEHQVFAAAAE